MERKCGCRAEKRSTGPWLAIAAAIGTALLAGCAGPRPAADDGAAGALTELARPAGLVIRDVRLFDGEEVHDPATVVVRDGRIVAVGPGIPVPPAAEVVDGRGHTLLPGLIDAHTHTFADAPLEASLAFGVTTVLDMFTAPESVRRWRAEQDSGAAEARADILSAGLVATAPGGHGTQYGMPIPTVDSPAEAAAFVTARLEEGSAFLKIIIEDGSTYGRPIPSLDAARVKALVAAAHDHGVLAVVHVATLASARMALEAGADGLVHLWSDRVPGPALARRMAAEMFVVPTLTVLQSARGITGGRTLLEDGRVRPLLTPEAERNLEQSFPAPPELSAAYDTAVAALLALHRAGATILAGSDAPNPGTTHGASLHRELELLVQAGLSPVEALRAATAAPAGVFGLGDRGRIATGRRADMVLVAGDPTKDITATRSIARVWKAGVELDRAGYAARVAAARAEREARAREPGHGPVLLSDFEDGAMRAALGAGWSETTDAMMGGTSTVALAVEPAEGGMALRVTGEVVSGPPFTWSGAMLFPSSPPMTATNLSGATGIAFRARGDGGAFRVLLFQGAPGMAPAMVEFTAGPGWTEHAFPWSAFDGADGREVLGIAFVSMREGAFELWLDDVALR